MPSTVCRLRLIALLAAVPLSRAPAQPTISNSGVARDTPAQRAQQATGAGKSNVFPALEIGGFLVLLNVFDRVAFASLTENGRKVFSSTFATTWDNLRIQRWENDPDSFRVNQFGHPFQGSMMYGLARSAGHGFWASAVHANIGSFLWEMAGETVPPSINDLITTSQAGSLLGEALYRMADLVLRDGGAARPNRLHEYTATMILPSGGFNRRAFGDRFKRLIPGPVPAASWQLKMGATLDAVARDYSAPSTLLRRDATAEFSMSYGLPGQPGYGYRRPLDYFDVQLSALTTLSNPVENLMIRGLLVGAKTRETATSRGIWGLYGTYDYISPYLFRVSTTALSIGTTRQYWLRPGLALQGTVLGGVGYGAAGSSTVIPSTPTNAAIRDYHFGIAPQALAAFRFIVADRAAIDLTGREYYVSGIGSDDRRGSETIFRGRLGVTVRLLGGHAIGAQYVASARDARYGNQPNRAFSEGTVTVSYSLLGGNKFGAVAWD